MHSRRVACLFLGFWLGGCVLMGWTAAHSFRNVDRVLTQPGREARLQLQTLGSEGARRLLRYQASEQNRSAFETWEIAQIFLGMGFFFYLLLGTREGKVSLGIVLLMLLIVLVQRVILTPDLTAMGRNLDYAPPGSAASERSQFQFLHLWYGVLEALKLGLGLALGAKLISNRGRSGDSRKELNPVDKSNHGHVNR